jgi:predicted nuclease of predicted toxin-antitoxin system
MRLLLDECVPRKLKFMFAAGGHECDTVREAGYGGKTNGELLASAESTYDVLVTIDKNIRFQQNLTGRRIALLILRAPSNDVSDIRPLVPDALAALESIQPGAVIEIGESTRGTSPS